MPMRMLKSKYRLDVLLSPGFIIALGLLLLNDYYLKVEYPNWLTGKLSDLSGLFMFSLFWFAFFPDWRRCIVFLTGAIFAFWKSPFSQPLIDVWNDIAIIQMARVVDYSDLIALLMLPLSYKYFFSVGNIALRKSICYPVLFVSLFAITGTSTIGPMYFVKFGMQAVTMPGGSFDQNNLSQRVNDSIKSIAERHGLVQKAYYGDKGNYRHYLGKGTHMETNFDDVTKTLFVSIRTYNPEQERTEVDAIQKEIFDALNSQFKNLTVIRDSYSYHRKDPVTTIQVKTPLVSFPLPSWCKSNGLNNKEIMTAFEVTRDYLKVRSQDDSSGSFCHFEDSCGMTFCRSYEFGKIIGSGEFDRSTTVQILFGAHWGGANLYIDFIEHAEDDSVNIKKMVDDLRHTLRNALHEDTVIEIKRKEVFGRSQ